MFLVDLSPSMGTTRNVELPPDANGDQHTAEITNLEYGLQFVKLKIQEMVSEAAWEVSYTWAELRDKIYNGRKTDQCGVIVFGSEGMHTRLVYHGQLFIPLSETDNIVNEKNGGYEHVSEYIPIGQPNAGTLAKLDALEPSSVAGDRERCLSEKPNVLLRNISSY